MRIINNNLPLVSLLIVVAGCFGFQQKPREVKEVISNSVAKQFFHKYVLPEYEGCDSSFTIDSAYSELIISDFSTINPHRSATRTTVFRYDSHSIEYASKHSDRSNSWNPLGLDKSIFSKKITDSTIQAMFFKKISSLIEIHNETGKLLLVGKGELDRDFSYVSINSEEEKYVLIYMGNRFLDTNRDFIEPFNDFNKFISVYLD